MTSIHGKRFKSNDSGGKTAHTVLSRADVPVEETWDVSTIFVDVDAWELEFETIKAGYGSFAAFAGTLDDPKQLLTALDAYTAVTERFARLIVYAHLRNDEDTANSLHAGLFMRAQTLAASLGETASFLKPEIASLGQDRILEMQAVEPGLVAYAKFLDDIVRFTPHLLSEREEKLLAGAAPLLNSGVTLYSTLSNADLKYPFVTDDDGNRIELTDSRYGRLLESKKCEVRKEAFEAMFGVYGQFKNTCAAALASQLRKGNFEKDVRGYATAREAALFENAIPVSVYDALVEAVESRLDLLHRFSALKKKALGLAELHSYDLYAPIIDAVEMTYTFEEAMVIIRKALAVLGEDYLDILDKAVAERWIDRAENRGKRSGAYSSGTYGTNPFILINWQGTMDNLFTLAHELGHSIHSYYSCRTQPPQYADYSIFLAEIASTLNENLLADYLLKTLTDEDAKRYVVAHFVDGFKGTVFRQTQFAAFEQLIYDAEEKGTAITADYLVETYGELNRRYYGEALTFDPEIGLEWARIPHFYYNFYVFQYATGFSAAAAFAGRILAGEDGAVEAYKNVLKAGESDYPINVLKKAGLDMTKPEAVRSALAMFERYLTELEARF